MANVDPRCSKFFQTPKSESETEEELQAYEAHKELVSTLPNENGFYLYRNFWFLEGRLLGILSAQKHFKPYPDDIFLITYPKSGTTWIRALAFAVVNRRKFSFDDHPLLTTHPQQQDIAIFFERLFGFPQVPDLSNEDVVPRPRIFASHVPYSLLPDSVKDAARIICVLRDPKDVLVSLWRFARANELLNCSHVPLDETFEGFCQGRYSGPIWDHQMEYMKESVKRPESVLCLKYEEMKEQPEECARRLAEFLGQPFTREEEEAEAAKKIARMCSFEFLAALEVNKEGGVGVDYSLKNSSFFRKGKVGDWKEHLSPEMAEKIDRITQEKMSQYGLV